MIKNYTDLIKKVENIKIDKNIDLSAGEDLSVGIMNLIGIEEHLFFTLQKTKNKKYLDLLNEVRLMRTNLMKKIVKDPEGEVWCISKHLLSSSMRMMEVGTKELKKAEVLRGRERLKGVERTMDLFEKSYKLYSLFWALNLSENKNIKSDDKNMKFVDEKGKQKGNTSVFTKFNEVVQKALDCCRE